MVVNPSLESDLKTLIHDNSLFDVRRLLFVTKPDTHFSV